LFRIVKPVLLAVGSIVLTLLAVEGCLALFVEITDDVVYDPLPGVGLRLRPRQDGLYIREGIRARFHVNNAGFNNPRDYVHEKKEGLLRIAVVGDSYVEALHVDPEESFVHVLEERLRANGLPVEIYSFGISGYGTAQVYHLVDEYVLDYSPDLVIYLFVRNDPDDSVKCRTDKQWTLQYGLSADGQPEPLPYASYELSPIKRLLKGDRLFRYFFYQRRLLERMRPSPPEQTTPRETPLDPCEQTVWPIVEALLAKLDHLLDGRGTPWLLVWMGDRDPAFHLDMRTSLEAIAGRYDIPYYDLSADFAADFRQRGREFRIPGDGHWNADGNRVAGTALATPAMVLLEGNEAARPRGTEAAGR